MALSATIFRFDLDISDVDRGVYDAVELRVAQHPSEAPEYMVARVLAWALNHQEGLAFASGGVSQSEEPPLFVDDLTGRRTHWIEVGHPSADRLHKAAKASPQVSVYVHKALSPWLENLRSASIHKADEIEVVALPVDFVDALAGSLARSNAWAVVRTEGELYVTSGEQTFQAVLEVHRLVEPG